MEATKLLRSDFLDILFDERNKSYGAYELRRRYNNRVRNSVMGMAGFVGLVIGGYLVSTRLVASDHTPAPVVVHETTVIREIPVEERRVTPPPTVREPAPAALKPTEKFATPKIVENDKVPPEDEVKKISELENKAIGFKSNPDGDPDGSDIGVPEGQLTGGSGVVTVEGAPTEEKPFITVEIMPEFPGGEAALMKYLKGSIRYPHMAAENNIQGTVFVRFVVQANGEIANVEVQGAKHGGGLEEEAMRVVKKMPKWKPGRQQGRNVPVYFNLPIKFFMEVQ
ncbi:TonB family protein [Chitinophaga lutea]